MSNHLRKTKTGIVWSFINQGGNQIINLLVTFVLARLITPKEFGTIGMIAVFTSFAKIFVDFGFSTALIQKKEISKKDIDTVFCVNIFFGLMLTIIFFFLAPLIADFYDKPTLMILTRALSPIFLISALSGVNRALTFKNLNIKLNTIIILAATVVSSVSAILMAYHNFGEWSILVKMLIDGVIITILFLIHNPLNQKLRFSRNSFMGLFKFGSNVAGDATINYWSRNADNLLIGKFLGESDLGIYTKAYAVMMLPLRNISGVISKVMFPSFSILQDDILQIRIIYLKATKLIAFITFPMMTGLAILAKPFVLVAFGENWLAMIPVISILALLGAVQSILSLNGVIYNALGKSYIAFRVTLVMSVIYLTSFIIGIMVGELLGLVIAYALAGFITAAPNFYIAGKQIGVSVLDMLKNLSNSFFCSAGMALGLFVLKIFLVGPAQLAPIFNLLILTISGSVFYFSISYFFGCEEVELAKKVFKK
ncbi:lipopolysaccharide biosynthesis protein [Gramella jeungdoensis]|uniref:Lipopolysaccharide biosynthesis protein n=1 Tax=Gramella jeungdoensis TaxID=708091 RepID=A0ABT0Z4P3_9FLAO|nr:lipopolysaccharide biosynthesis protein [Gramella jeungdoensis]MCM8570489.1 lipopolysaccharide biosynthesis protein [Gramella jeungdoensis]